VETIANAWVEYGIAEFILPGEELSGDRSFVGGHENGVLIAAIDGVGHGEEAANATKTAMRRCELAGAW
jgi:phosphoserine phosphatase RsbX